MFHDFIRDTGEWKTVGRQLQFENEHLQVFHVTTRTPVRPDGCEWTVVHRKGAVVIVPRTADGKFVLVRQERVPVRDTMWEFPAGQIDGESEHNDRIIRETGLRELKEESGYDLAPEGELVPLGHFFPSAGFTDEHSHLFYAYPVVISPDGHEHDANEAITGCRAFSYEELREMIARNVIRDANTLAAFARLVALQII